MSNPVEGLEPTHIWRYFAEICQIPHGSGNEQRIGQYVLDEAGRLGLETYRDELGNILVRKGATRGCEKRHPVCLQCHLDMVCEKNKNVAHDFRKDPIQIRREGDWVYATGTTLGSDNGVGIAACLALMSWQGAEHGPLELLFTINEENGMTGVRGLKQDLLQSRILINLDSEEEGVFFIGCAGAVDVVLSLKAAVEEPPTGCSPYLLEVTGLKGGHSGLDIGDGRASAIRILVRTLFQLRERASFRLASLRAGNMRNAIPREGEALLFAAPGEFHGLSKTIEAFAQVVRNEFRIKDPNLTISLKPAESTPKTVVLTPGDQDRVLRMLCSIPHGVWAMSAAVPGLVETSTNFGVLEMAEGVVTARNLLRSSVESSKQSVVETIQAIGALAGAEIRVSGEYPGWQPNPDSPTLCAAKKVFSRLFGHESRITGMHAGLECAIIGGKFPGMDMLSFGPTLQSVHSPDERLQISSVPRFWTLTCELLKVLG